MADQTLQDLYKLQPTAQAAIQKSAGCAVFNNMGTNLLLVSTARGAGVAVNSNTKQETFMKMISAGAGLGIGVKDYRVIFVFENDKALASFLDSGWSGSGQADAAAKAGEKGAAYSGAVEVAPGVLGLPDYQEWCCPPVDRAGYEVLQGRRPQQKIIAPDREARSHKNCAVHVCAGDGGWACHLVDSPRVIVAKFLFTNYGL
jgi:hypothetical protein